MSCTTRTIGAIIICISASLAWADITYAQTTAPKSSEDCKAPPVQQNPSGKGRIQSDHDLTGSADLSDCGGVIKPAETGDNMLVQPAPPSSNMPVVKPKDLPDQQQNAQ